MTSSVASSGQGDAPLVIDRVTAVLFDCDGVLLDSNDLKTSAFASVLRTGGYTEDVIDRFLAHQRRNFGRSRYLLFDDLYTDVLQRAVDKEERAALLSAFAAICREGYVAAEVTLGTLQLLPALARLIPLYVVSGSDEEELRDVLAQHRLAQHFVRITGSPTKKKDNVAAIVEELGEHPESVLLIGDAVADVDAATANGLRFVGLSRYSSDVAGLRAATTSCGFPLVSSLADLHFQFDDLLVATGV